MEDGRQAAMKSVQLFLEAYSRKDLDGCVDFFAKKSPILVLGTNDNEIFRDPAALKDAFRRDFSMMNDIVFGDFRHLHVEAGDRLASVLLELPISYESDGEDIRTLFRYALTLTREGGDWKVCAGMASVPFKSGTYSF